jgi:hypothetical protein
MSHPDFAGCILCVHNYEVGNVSDRSLGFAWCVCINCRNRRSLCNVQRGCVREAACARGNMEQCVVSFVRICSDKLYEKLGVRGIRCGRVLGRSFPIDDVDWKVIEGRPSTSPGAIAVGGLYYGFLRR